MNISESEDYIMSNIKDLPDNYNELSHDQQLSWFAKNWLPVTGLGQYGSIPECAPDNIKKAYHELIEAMDRENP